MHDPALLYQLEIDVGETYPIDPTSVEFTTAMATINKAAAAHKASLTPVPNQMALGNNPKYRVCCKNATRDIESGLEGKNE